MKYLIWLVILGIAGFLIYHQFIESKSEEEEEVKQVEKVFNQAVDRYITAMREAGEPGLVVIADPEFAIKKVKEVRIKVTELIRNLKEDAAITRAQKLETKIREFCRKNDID